MGALIVVGLLVGGVAVWWVTSPPGSTMLLFMDPDDYVGRVPPLTRLETYPRLVPWRLESLPEVDSTVLALHAVSYACNLSNGDAAQVKETLDRVEVYETADTVTIETWLGPPEADGFWPKCKGTGAGFSVRVELEDPLGNRRFVGPACNLDRHARTAVCRTIDTSYSRWRYGSRTGS